MKPINHTPADNPGTNVQDMAASRAWSLGYFDQPSNLPISFVLDGQQIRGIPASWHASMQSRWIDANIIETQYEGTDPASGVKVRVLASTYRDFPVVEWVAWFSNSRTDSLDSKQFAPLISDIQAMDVKLNASSTASKTASDSDLTTRTSSPAQLYHCNGDYYSIDGYTPQWTPIHDADTYTFAPNGGRACDGAFPYFRVAFADWGATIAVGWPAQWQATFNGQGESVHVLAGQQKTNLRLQPGETIRTPRMTVMAWSGDNARAVNLWRRWYLAHILPRPNGQPMPTLLACAATDEGEEFTGATEENQIHYIDRFLSKGIQPTVWWIDAGWYPCRNAEGVRRWWRTGSWMPDPERFPNGLKPISDHAANAGANLLVWFEPERIQPGTWLDNEHSDWLLRIPENDNALLNLGIPECRQWLTDHYCKLIQDNGIKIYRQDHNFPPLDHWRKNEAQDRQGINENLHVQGYLQFWDDLLMRNPGLWIDSCASGGRRNDLETMRRSVPLHFTDYGYGDHQIKLAFHHTMYEWIPYFKECTLSWDQSVADRFDQSADSFSYHCGMAAMLFATMDIRRDDYDFGTVRTMLDVWRSVADVLLHGDYYPHTDFHKDNARWVAWQFDQPEENHGYIQAIRLQQAPQASITIQPRAINADANYIFNNPETGESCEVSGAVLIRDGFTITLSQRQGAVWLYHMAG